MKRFKYIIEFVFLFGCNGVMLWFFRGYVNLVIAAGMLVFLVYALVSVHIVKRYVTLDLEIPVQYMTKNIPVCVKIKLENRCIFPIVNCRVRLYTGNVFAGQTVQNDLIVPTRPLGTTVVDYPLRSSCVGNVEITVDGLILEDVLMFHAVSKSVGVSKNVYIIQSGESGREFSLQAFEKGMAEAEESQLRGSDFSDVSHIREYIPGDAMKNIHWKLSAKKDVWMVKERRQMSSRKLLVVLALDKTSVTGIDRTVETLFALGNFVIGNRVPVTLFWWSDKFMEIRQGTAETEEEWQHIMLQLFYTQAGSGFVEEQFRSLNPGQDYVLVNDDFEGD